MHSCWFNEKHLSIHAGLHEPDPRHADPTSSGTAASLIVAMNAEVMRFSWLVSRIYIILLAILTSVMVINVEAFMHVDMQLLAWGADPVHYENWILSGRGITPWKALLAPCQLLMPTLASVTLVFSCIFAFLHSLHLMASSWGSLSQGGRCRSALEVLLSPVAVGVFWYIINLETDSYQY